RRGAAQCGHPADRQCGRTAPGAAGSGRALGQTDIEMVTETYWRATHYMTDVADQYAAGKLSLSEKALAEQCYFALCNRLYSLLKARQRSHRQVLDELNDKMADKYICNF